MKQVRDAITRQQQQVRDQISDSFEKGKKEPIGMVKEWKGKKMKKVAEGKWVPVSEGKSGAAKEDPKGKKPAAKEEGGNQKQAQPEESQAPKSTHYKDMDVNQLHETAEKLGIEGHADMKVKELRATVGDAIISRNIKEGLKKIREQKKKNNDKDGGGEGGSGIKKQFEKKKAKIKEWLAKQKEDYDLDPEGASFLRKKAQGIAQGVKHEIHEWKEAASGVKKFVTGDKDSMTKHEKKAIRDVAIHVGIVVALSVTGGVAGGSLAAKAATLGKSIALGYLEHAGLIRGGHALAFAKGELDDEEASAFIEHMINDMADFLQEK